MRARIVLSSVGLALVVALVDAAAHAQPPATGELERARALYAEAGELEQKGDWQSAQERLREALRIRETPNLRYALAWALENDNQLIEARNEYELALRLASRAGNEEVKGLATQRINEVDHETPLVQVRVKGALTKGMRVVVDGREVQIHGDAGTMPVDPGSRVVRVENGEQTSEQTVTLGRGGLRVVEVKGAERLVVLDDTADQAKTPKLPWVLVGGGGVLLVTGILLFVSSSSDASTRDDKQAQWCTATACANGTTATLPESDAAVMYRREASDAATHGNTKQIVGGVLGGIGAVGIGVGTVLLLRRHHADEPARVSFDASPLPGGAHAGATFVF